MKRLSVSFLVAFISFFVLAQSTQPCVVKQYNQKEEKTPLPAVEVVVSNAGSTVSDNAGKLTLSFRTLKPGDKVNLVSAKKKGFEVMNTDAVDQWNISTDQRPFELVMVNSEFFAQLKSRLRETSIHSYKSKYDEAVKEVEALKKAAKISEEDYYRKLDELETQYMNSLKNIDTYIDQFARIDLSEVSAEEQRILEMVEDGRIDEAVKAWDELDILNILLQEKRDHKELSEAAQAIREAIIEKMDNIDHLEASLRNQIATLKLAGGKENYDKIGRMLKKKALADTTNVEAIWDYASFAHNQHDYPESERFYRIAHDIYMALFKQNPNAYRANLAAIQNSIGGLYKSLRAYAKSEEYYLNALANKTVLFAQNPDAYRADLARTQNNLGGLYSDLHDYVKSEEYYMMALENRMLLFNQNHDAYRADLAMTQNNLGTLYFHIHDYVKSEEYYLKALDNWTSLFNQNVYAYRSNLAVIQHNLGNLYKNLNAYCKSEEYYLKALENRTLLFNNNPDAYRVELASTQNNLGGLYKALSDYVKSEEFYLKALENKTVLFEQNPNAYRYDLASTQNNLGSLYKALHVYANSETYYLKALDNFTDLFSENSNAYRDPLALTQYNLGDLFFDLHVYSKSEEYYLMALENYKVLFEESPTIFRARLARLQYSLMYIYANGNYPINLYDAMLEDALVNCEVLYKEDSGYQPMIVELRIRKGLRLLESGRTDDALALIDGAYQLAPEQSAPFLAIAYNSKAYEYLRITDYTRSLETIDEAIALMPKVANYYDSKGAILLSIGDAQGALEMWKKVLELEPEFLSRHPNGTGLYNGLKQKGLITE